MTMNDKPNRLAKEKSPYLLQHAYNPVDWFPWSDEAFEIAKRENKPVFLSIGYSTCHWCHVMERESFEDEEVAELLNKHFVSIKVDREERPDVDHLYMTVCQALTGNGGWPLTVVMTPDKKPFLAGTYFPKNHRFGRKGLMEILPQIADKWENANEDLLEIGDKLVEEIQRRMLSNLQGELSEEILEQAYGSYEQLFDSQYGGFGHAPKFPTPHNLSFLLRYYNRSGETHALHMAERTLDAMYRGGMNDHIGFGFARYSTDDKWLVPHFEKMLYDNALLAWTYLEAYQVTGNRSYADVAERIFQYVLRDMTDPDGGFYSAEDADSEGHEGKFYVWNPEEIIEVLGEKDGELYCELYGVTEEGNFEGMSIPNLIGRDLAVLADRKQLNKEELRTRMESCRIKLFERRERRIHPGKDDKVLTSWNGLMIMALSKGYMALGQITYLEAAEKAVRFIQAKMRREDGRLLARYRDGEAAYPGYVDDYAFLVWGLLELYEASLNFEYLQLAMETNQQMIDLFWDEEQGGLFFYGKDSEQLIVRGKEIYDGAMPSGNSVAAGNLLKLARLTGDRELMALAERQLHAFAGSLAKYPSGHSMLLIALDYAYGESGEIVIVGDPEDEGMQDMTKVVHTAFRPYTRLLFVPKEEAEAKSMKEWLPLIGDKKALHRKVTAYVCENFSCQKPITDVEELKRKLASQGS
ncbi:thioredoxin domain-containing protein [Paenibacillus tarimensis]